MGQVMSAIIIVLLIIFIFVPLSVLNRNNAEIRDLKQSLNLSARVLDNCVSKDEINIRNLAEGYEKPPENDIKVDKDRLLIEFYDVLYKNIYIKNRFDEVKARLYIKILVYRDMFFIADNLDKWSPPFFFTFSDKNCGEVYLSINDNKAYYYDKDIKIYETLNNFGLDDEKRNEIIIKSINDKVAQFTYEVGERNSLKIQILNPYTQDVEYKVNMSKFNVLEGVTFFVVYAEDTRINVNSKDFHFKNYNVTGYTMNY